MIKTEHYLALKSNVGLPEDNLWDVVGFNCQGIMTGIIATGIKITHALALIQEYETNENPKDE